MMLHFEVWKLADGRRLLVETKFPLVWDYWYGFSRPVKHLL